MIEKKTIARPYARAAFEQASSESSLSSWSEVLSSLAVIMSDEDMLRLVNDPGVSTSDLESLILSVLGGSLDKPLENFVKLLVESDRLSIAPEISALFDERKAESEKHASVQVISAYKVNDTEKKMIADAMQKKLGRSVEIEVEEDSALIGGIVVKSGDMVIDLSLKGRLSAMGNEFK